jgi:peptidoglycan hydrolase CwlO-like protein
MLKVIPLLIAVFVFVVGCGPKGASQEQLATLAQSKAACDAGESKLKEIEAQKADLEAQITERQNTLKELQDEFNTLEKTLTDRKQSETKETK